MTITIGEMREFLSYMSDDTLAHVEAAASREAAAFGATAIILFVVALCLWFQFRPSGPRGGE